MIERIQNTTAFKGVYLRVNGKAIQNIKEAYDKLKASDNPNKGFLAQNIENKSFNATLRYGLARLNDDKIDDGETRFLTFHPIYSKTTGIPSGYSLSILDENGNKIAVGGSYIEGASIYALKTAFDNLREDYEEVLAAAALKNYEYACSYLDTAIEPYTTEEGPENS